MGELIFTDIKQPACLSRFIGLLQLISDVSKGNYHTLFEGYRLAGEKETIVKNIIETILYEFNSTGSLSAVVSQVVRANLGAGAVDNVGAFCELCKEQYLYRSDERVYLTNKLLQHLLLHFLPMITRSVSVITEIGALPIDQAKALIEAKK